MAGVGNGPCGGGVGASLALDGAGETVDALVHAAAAGVGGIGAAAESRGVGLALCAAGRVRACRAGRDELAVTLREASEFGWDDATAGGAGGNTTFDAATAGGGGGGCGRSAGTAGTGNIFTNAWDKIKNIPTSMPGGGGTPSIPSGSSAAEFVPSSTTPVVKTGLGDILGIPENIQAGLDVVQKGNTLLNQLTDKTGQASPTGGLQRQRVKRDVSTLIPNSVTMVDPNKWAEMTTLNRPGGLNMTRGV